MGKQALSKRKNWQTISGAKASRVEYNFEEVFKDYFKDTNYELVPKPKNLLHIYEDVPLLLSVSKEIYNPKKKYVHGLQPDFLIKNLKTGKSIYIEIKRQDGWVENTKPSAGRGNAHERSNKYFTPGLLKLFREETKLNNNNNLPFCVIFIGNITRDPKRVREITLWYGDMKDHFFMWRDLSDKNSIIKYFKEKIKPLLD